MSHDRFSIAVLVQTASSWGADLVAGVAEYIGRVGPWMVHLEARGQHEKLTLPRGWRGDGVIGRFNSPQLIQQVRQLGVPAVNVSWSTVSPPDVPRVTADEQLGGELAGEYFLEGGYAHFGYCGPIDRPDYSTDRFFMSFADRLADAERTVDVYQLPRSANYAKIDERNAHLTQWLSARSLPLALLTWSDSRAREIVQACWAAGLRVPDDVSLLSAEQEPTMSVLAGIELSSLNLAPFRVGYKAAELLHRMMRGDGSDRADIRIPPIGVTVRASSNRVAVDDPYVAAAVAFVADHYDSNISTADIVDASDLGQRALEQRFVQALGRTPAQELRRRRLEAAKQLLRDTDMTVDQIAERCGYTYARVLTRNLKSALGVTPGQFRGHL